MSKYEYLSRLEKLLSALPDAERADALRYYEEYFDAAGDDEKTARELGEPEEVARKILEPNTEADAPAQPAAAPTATAAGDTAARHISPWLLAVLALLLVTVLVIAFALPRRAAATANANGIAAESASGSIAESASSNTADNTAESVAAIASGSGEPQTDDTDDVKRCTSDAKTLEFNINVGTVVFEVDDSIDIVQVEASGKLLQYYSVSAESDDGKPELKIKVDIPSNLAHDISDGPEIRISAPSGYFEEIDLDASVCNVDFGTLSAGELSANVQVGQIKYDELTARSVEISTEVGNVEGDAISTEKLRLETSVGSIDSGLVKCATDVKTECEVGSIDLSLEGVAADYVTDAKVDFGSIKCDGEIIAEKNADVSGLNPLGSRKLELEVSQGQISVSFAGGGLSHYGQ